MVPGTPAKAPPFFCFFLLYEYVVRNHLFPFILFFKISSCFPTHLHAVCLSHVYALPHQYTFLVKLKFSRPVHKDVPQAVAVKICNQTFQENILETKSEAMWKFFNDFYVCESRFYTDYRSSLSCACADIYWTELEYPEDPYTQFGHYGVMIEYVVL